MTLRWFGESWGAPVCELEQHVGTPEGKQCVYCTKPIEDGEQGVVMAASPEIPGRYVYSVRDPDTNELRSSYVVASHRDCLAEAILGPGATIS